MTTEISPEIGVPESYVRQESKETIQVSSVAETLNLIRDITTDIVSSKLRFHDIEAGAEINEMIVEFVQAIISIAGPHRTGKSFLLDHLTPHDAGVHPFQVIL